MLILNELVYTTMTEDATLISLMGITSTDKRVYLFDSPKDTVFNDSKKALIFYKIGYGKRPAKWSYPKQYPNASLYLRVQSSEQLVCEQVCDALENLFDLKINTLQTDDVSVKFSEVASRNKGTLEGPATKAIYTNNMVFSFKGVFAR